MAADQRAKRQNTVSRAPTATRNNRPPSGTVTYHQAQQNCEIPSELLRLRVFVIWEEVLASPSYKSIVTACHGDINVESEVGKGSKFWFWIPVEIIEKE